MIKIDSDYLSATLRLGLVLSFLLCKRLYTPVGYTIGRLDEERIPQTWMRFSSATYRDCDRRKRPRALIESVNKTQETETGKYLAPAVWNQGSLLMAFQWRHVRLHNRKEPYFLAVNCLYRWVWLVWPAVKPRVRYGCKYNFQFNSIYWSQH